MNRFHFRVHVGSTTVARVASMLRESSLPWQVVTTIEKPQHVHFSILALYENAAWREIDLWFRRAELYWLTSCDAQLLFAEKDDNEYRPCEMT